MSKNEKPISRRDIQIISHMNGEGKLFIIGDIHGGLDILKQVLKKIGFDNNPNNILICVGDLVDRGPQSKEVIEFVAQHNNIYTVRGNHEDLALHTLLALQNTCIDISFDYLSDEQKEALLKKHPDVLQNANEEDYVLQHFIDRLEGGHYPAHLYPSCEDIYLHYQNGGAWLIKLFIKEYNDNMIIIDENNRASYDPQSDIKFIKSFLYPLPYIIHVEGKKPCNIVHADLPFMQEADLKDRVESGLGLTSAEKEYATWARLKARPGGIKIRDNHRNGQSEITYVGHTIITKNNVAECVRAGNTINLDVGSYYTGTAIVADHYSGRCLLSKSDKNLSHLIDAQSKIEEHYIHLDSKQHDKTPAGLSKFGVVTHEGWHVTSQREVPANLTSKNKRKSR